MKCGTSTSISNRYIAFKMNDEIIATRVFTRADQLEFSRLSEDHNPMHVDEVVARRTQAGAPVVHGVHAAIWALDTLAAMQPLIDQIRYLDIRFAKFLYLDTPVVMKLVRRSETEVKIELVMDGLSAMSLVARVGSKLNTDEAATPDETVEITTAGTRPNEPSFEELQELAGWMTPPGSASDLALLYPNAARALSAKRLVGLAQLSRLVGMISPGLHSIFTSLTLDLVDCRSDRPGVGFKTAAADPRFQRIKMDVAGNGLSGAVVAFMRWPPVQSPPIATLMKYLSPAEFAGSHSLVVGGSRGLGAVTAKLLAAGGGKVTITYARGQSDAQQLAEETNTVRGPDTCAALALDVRHSIAMQLMPMTETISHLYYFATPYIFRAKSEIFSPTVYEEFNRVYLVGFVDTVRFLFGQPRQRKLSVFYPSSVSINERPSGMTEYSMAKAAGELLCADLQTSVPQLRILAPRLPRMLTDQTATVAASSYLDSVEVMLPLIRQVQDPVPTG